MTNIYLKLAIGVGAALSITACTAGQTGPPDQKTVDPTQNGNSKLSLAVGTANIAGGTGLGLNVVAFYRQKNGASAVLVDTPKLAGPFTLPAAASVPSGAAPQYDSSATADVGPSAAEIAGKFIEGSPQPTQVGRPSSVTTTFGVFGGVFGNGFAPVNYGTNGLPAEQGKGTNSPYYEPFYAGTNLTADGSDIVTTSSAFLPTAGPPAFDPASNGAGATGPNFPFNGLTLGLNVFARVVPVSGAYTLSVSIPTTGNTLSPTPASATLASPAVVVPVATNGGAPAVTFNGDGSATVTNVALSAPAVGAYIQVIDYGPIDTTTGQPAKGCNGATVGTPVFYTHWVTAGGPVTFANANAPLGQTSAVCTAEQNATALNTSSNTDVYTGDRIQAVVIAFDYNEYALQYNGETGATYPQAPALPGQADSSISLSAYATSP